MALVDEARCIGCTLCIDACPVDAIVGAQTLMHTVVEPWCIGCRLCVPPCPVDCIEIVAARPLSHQEKSSVKTRAKARQARLSRDIFSSRKANPRDVIARALARKKRP